jgi:WD40 repeat protein
MLLMATALVLVTVVLGGWVWMSLQRAWHSDEVVALETQQRLELESQVYRLKMATAFPEFESEHYERALQILESTLPRSRGWEWHYLRAQLDQSVRVLPHVNRVVLCGMVRHQDSVMGVDSQNVARVWCRSTGEILSSRTIGEGTPLAIAPNGRWILSQLECPVLWDGATGEVVREFPDHPLPRLHLGASAISDDGSLIAITSDGLLLIDAATGELRHRFDTERLHAVTFSADSQWLVWCDTRWVKFWDVRQSKEARPPIKNASVGSRANMALSPDRSLLALPSGDRVVVWNLDTGNRRELHVDSHATALTDVGLCFNETGSVLITVGKNDAVRVWDPREGTPLRTLRIHHGDAQGLRSTNEAAGLLAIPTENAVQLWDVRNHSPLLLAGHGGFVYPVAISPDGELIASGSWDHTVRLWDAQTSEELAVLRDKPGFVFGLAFDPRRERLVSTSSNGNACVWDSATGELIQRLDLGSRVFAAGYSRDGASLILVHNGITVLDAGSLVLTKRIPDQRQSALCLGPNGHLFATWNAHNYFGGRLVKLWSLSTLEPIGSFQPPRRAEAATFTANGDQLVLGDVDGVISFWDVENLDRPVREFSGHAREIFALKYLPDALRLLSAGRDATIRIWDVPSGDVVGTLRGQNDYVYSLAVSPDGNRIVSGSGDRTVRIWEMYPLRRRLNAIREADSARPKAEAIVQELSAKGLASAELVHHIRHDDTLSPLLRREAMKATLRHATRRHSEEEPTDRADVLPASE